MRKAVKGIILLAVVILIIVCWPRSSKYYEDKVDRMMPEQVIGYYIKVCAEKNERKIYATVAGRLAMETIFWDSMEPEKLVEIKPAQVDTLPIIVNELYEAKVYEVTTKTRYRIGKPPPEEETLYYYVGRESENAGWRVYDVTKIEQLME